LTQHIQLTKACFEAQQKALDMVPDVDPPTMTPIPAATATDKRVIAIAPIQSVVPTVSAKNIVVSVPGERVVAGTTAQILDTLIGVGSLARNSRRAIAARAERQVPVTGHV
jgi:hypothetical protein